MLAETFYICSECGRNAKRDEMVIVPRNAPWLEVDGQIGIVCKTHDRTQELAEIHARYDNPADVFQAKRRAWFDGLGPIHGPQTALETWNVLADDAKDRAPAWKNRPRSATWVDARPSYWPTERFARAFFAQLAGLRTSWRVELQRDVGRSARVFDDRRGIRRAYQRVRRERPVPVRQRTAD